MRRTPMELAAVASAAVPGLTLTAAAYQPDDAADFDSAVLLDADRKRWRVRAPKHLEASTRLETELQVLRAFSPAVRAELPFLLPTVAGTLRIGELTTFVYSHLAGRVETVEDLVSGGRAVATEIGAAMAAIHDLPITLVQGADLPVYSANEFRQRRLNELDQAATTGKIPAALLRRWEHALEDVALWKFNPSVVHGDLHEDNILMQDQRLIAITGWTDLRVGDPSDDFAWLTAIENQDFVTAVQESYAAARHELPDRHLNRRAALSAEFALAQWLVRGVSAGDQQMVDEAEQMLHTLEADITQYGGQPISVEEPLKASAAAFDSSEAGSTDSKVTVESIPLSQAEAAEVDSQESETATEQTASADAASEASPAQDDTDTTALKVVSPSQPG
ncbi:macrolide 2'-phosphotransferase [Psychromicrobium sp. YIM B11713]|uniref:macrolide 2'-phosphotransferase n=1 Tax=Psychromicrobium sp. YIM B11713 TaxID=3145233 RepID=UPI00374FA5A8